MSKLEIRSILGLAALYSSRMFGLFMVLPVLSLYAGDYSGSTTLLIGVALGIYGLSQGLLQIPLGMLSDVVPRKAVIIGGMLLFLAGSVVAATSDSIYGLIVGRCLQGAGAIASAIMALLSDLTTEENRTKAMAGIGGSIGISFGLAMVIGPVLASAGGVDAVFWLTAALAALGILVVVFWVPSPEHVSALARREALTIPALISNTLKNGELLRLDLGVFILHMVQMANWVSVPYLLQSNLQLPLSQHWWFYLVTMSLGFVAMLPLVIIGEKKRCMKQVLIASITLLALGELLLWNGSDKFLLFACAMLVFFTAFNLLEASLPSLVAKTAPGGTRGTAMGFYASSQFLGTFCGGILGGVVVQHFGYQSVFVFAAAAVLIWIPVAATMRAPRHWSTVVVSLEENPHFPADAVALRQLLNGVEDVTCLLDQKLIYLKIDKDQFDQGQLNTLLANGK